MNVLPLFSLAAVTALAVASPRLVRRTAGSGRTFADQPAAAAAVAVLVFFVLLALAAPWVAPYRPSLQLDIVALQDRPPSWVNPMGTDVYSRDVWSRLVYGARASLGVGAVATLLGMAIAAAVGAAAGYFGRSADVTLMRLVDVGLAVPRIFLVLVVIAAGGRLPALGLALLLGLTGWFAASRMVRADVLSLRDAAFVDAARALGNRPWVIIGRHVLPNAAATLVVCTALALANMMLLEAALSFLGVGIQPPVPSWGNMIADARDQLATAPWSSLFPGLALTAVVMALHVVADALRDTLDPVRRD